MKTTFIAAAMAAISILPAYPVREDWANFKRYGEANRELMSRPIKERRVVFFGNSITDNWASMRPEFFSSNGFVGRGISGQSTYQFLSRFREDVVALRPKAVVINAATNDIAENTHVYDEERTFGNIVSMIEIARANGIKVILTSTLPAGHFSWNKDIKDGPEKIASLNTRLKKYAADHKIPFVDYHSKMISPDGRNMLPELTDDGVHPTDAGYEVMESEVLPVLRKLLKD